ncbi:MAG: GNAT family N-acetyltransferase [Marmoricola sp.]
MTLPPGWQTDVAVLRLGGAEVVAHDDHLVVREPGNPRHHWGNFVLVTDEGRVDHAEHWLARFGQEFPDAEHLAIGLSAQPATAPWAAVGLAPETDDVLTTDRLQTQPPCPDGYTARALATAEDWAQHVALAVRGNAATGEHEPSGFADFMTARAQTRQRLVERGIGAWFGAFHGEELVADLGIVDCGEATARYQSVGTDAAHRRRGLAGHLIGLAARWAEGRGCSQPGSSSSVETRYVIITEVDNPAGRLYRSLGFAPDVQNVQVYRAPAGDPVGRA